MAESTDELAGRIGQLIQDGVGGTSHDSEECAYNVLAEVGRQLADKLVADGCPGAADSVRGWTGAA